MGHMTPQCKTTWSKKMPRWREQVIFQSNVIQNRCAKLRCKTQSIPLSWTACISNQPASIAASFFSSLAQAAMIQQLKHWANKASFWLRLAIQKKETPHEINYPVLSAHNASLPPRPTRNAFTPGWEWIKLIGRLLHFGATVSTFDHPWHVR